MIAQAFSERLVKLEAAVPAVERAVQSERSERITTQNDIEQRLRRIERLQYLGMGGIMLLEFLLRK